MAAFHSMAHRITNMPLSIQNYKSEYDYMMNAAKVNGYRGSDVDRIIKKHSDKAYKEKMSTFFSQKERKKNERVRITYNPKITNKLTTTFEKQKMQLVYSVNNKIGSLLGSTKDKDKKEEKSGIYEITCDCNDKYSGQTRRKILTRFNEHKRGIKLNQPSKSSVASHAIENLHLNLDSLDLRVKKVITNPALLDAYESYFITTHNRKNPQSNLINTDNGNITSYLFNCI